MQKGSYVICIDDSSWSPEAHARMSSLPRKNEIYIVRRIIPRINRSCEDDGVALEGIFGDWDFFVSFSNQKIFEECHFRKSRFREIDIDEISLDEVLEVFEKEWV